MANHFFDERAERQTPVEKMRRSELYALAKKYHIDINPRKPKSKIMPAMLSAQDDGIFNRPPVEPEPPARTEFSIEHMGVKRKWCVLNNDNIAKFGFESKEAAEDWVLLNG